MPKVRLNLRIAKERLEKLKRVAYWRRKTMTQLIEEFIDFLEEEKPS
jgi:hypothetical protein